MEETSKVMGIRLGVKPHCNKRSLELRNSTMNMAHSRPPLGPASSFQVWKKPYSMNFLESSTSTNGATKAFDQQYLDTNPKTKSTSTIDTATTLLAAVVNEDHKSKVENAALDFKIPSPCTKVSSAISGAENDINAHSSEESGKLMVQINGVVQFKLGRNIDPNMEPRKLKRIISNRVSAQKSRIRKLEYVSAMEDKARTLEAQIALLSPQVSLYKNQHHLLKMEQKSLSQQMSVCANSKFLKDVEIEKNKAEVNRLRQLHEFKLQQQYSQTHARVLNWPEPALGLTDQIANSGLHRSGLGQYYSNQVAGVEDKCTSNTTTQLNNILIKQLSNMTQQQDQDQDLHAWTADIDVTPNLLMCSNQYSSAAGSGLHQLPNNLGAILDHHENRLNFNSTTTVTDFKYPSEPHYCFI